MGEFFVKAPEREFLNNSCSICLLPSSITCIHGYGFTSISLAVIAYGKSRLNLPHVTMFELTTPNH